MGIVFGGVDRSCCCLHRLQTEVCAAGRALKWVARLTFSAQQCLERWGVQRKGANSRRSSVAGKAPALSACQRVTYTDCLELSFHSNREDPFA